jgi:hypothetical protein
MFSETDSSTCSCFWLTSYLLCLVWTCFSTNSRHTHGYKLCSSFRRLFPLFLWGRLLLLPIKFMFHSSQLFLVFGYQWLSISSHFCYWYFSRVLTIIVVSLFAGFDTFFSHFVPKWFNWSWCTLWCIRWIYLIIRQYWAIGLLTIDGVVVHIAVCCI